MNKIKRSLIYLVLIHLGWIGFFSSAAGFSSRYLIASNAADNNDFHTAANSYFELLSEGLPNIKIYQEALVFLILADEVKKATTLVKTIDDGVYNIPASELIMLADFIKKQKFEKVAELLERHSQAFPDFLMFLHRGWSEIASGNFDHGIKSFLTLDGKLKYLASYNCALAFAMKGDFETASFYLEDIEEKNLNFDYQQLLAQVQIHSNHAANDKAIALLKKSKDGRDGTIFNPIISKLEEGKKLKFDAFETPSDAMANVFYLMGGLGDEEEKNYLAPAFYTQLAKYVAKHNDFYTLRVAEIFSRLDVNNSAIENFSKVPITSPFFLKAKLSIVEIFIDEGRDNEAMSILNEMLEQGFTDSVIFDSLADIFRGKKEYNKAIKYYDRVLATAPSQGNPLSWSTFFLRGISYDQSGNWEKAQLDLNIALELYPNHPEVLNYLGYSLIERNTDLVKALGMIQNAVRQKPQSGYIVDSLAWCLFRLGKYDEAIIPMEIAIQLEPNDPIVNDHLGDILWMVGRKREARFQWKRALLFKPTLENENKIRKKFKVGIPEG